MSNILLLLQRPSELFRHIEKSQTIIKLSIAAISRDMEDAKCFKNLLRAVRYNSKICELDVSENLMTPACFHVLRDCIVR